MLVSELSEFSLIELLSRELGIAYPAAAGQRARSGLLVDLGDDAVVSSRSDGSLIWTTDTLVAGVHFLPGAISWQDLGWKAMAVNLSDIAAMGGKPHLALVTLSLPADSLVDDLIHLYRGLHEAALAFGVLIAGGDIVGAPVFSLSVALSGWAMISRLGQPQVLKRNTARAGDLVAVTGTLGDSAAGLRLQDSTEGGEARQFLVSRHQRPQPRVEVARLAVEAGLTCAIDISDGLVQDLGHVARASGQGISIDASRVPMSDALINCFPSQALGLALAGGEDYELGLVGSPLAMEALLASQTTVPLTIIGRVVEATEPQVVVLDERGQEIPLGRPGWDHLRAL